MGHSFLSCPGQQGKRVPKPALVWKPIQELGIGTFRNIATVRQTQTLHDALSIFVDRRVSALPVVDDEGESWKYTRIKSQSQFWFKSVFWWLHLSPGKVVSLYSRFDVIVSVWSFSEEVATLSAHQYGLTPSPSPSTAEPRRPEDLQQPRHDHGRGLAQTHVFLRGCNQMLPRRNPWRRHWAHRQSWGRAGWRRLGSETPGTSQSQLSHLAQVHRLVLVDRADIVRGIISLSDLLQAMVLTPAGIEALFS